jgi:hypothetical protein
MKISTFDTVKLHKYINNINFFTQNNLQKKKINKFKMNQQVDFLSIISLNFIVVKISYSVLMNFLKMYVSILFSVILSGVHLNVCRR